MNALAVFLCLNVVTAINVSAVGDPVTVWAAVDFLHQCGYVDVPDIPARVYVDDVNTTHMVVGSTAFHHMTGPSPLNVSRSCAIAYNETKDPDPAMFAGDEFLDSTVAFSNGTVVTLIHTEYPGNVYGNCTGPAYPHCWTVTIGLGISYDWGMTWQHARPPPNHLVAAVPYGYNQSQLGETGRCYCLLCSPLAPDPFTPLPGPCHCSIGLGRPE
jgi:hypothetical protein